MVLFPVHLWIPITHILNVLKFTLYGFPHMFGVFPLTEFLLYLVDILVVTTLSEDVFHMFVDIYQSLLMYLFIHFRLVL